ncbi:MAG: MoaD/ThiS family protein [Planctomycetaceae bacterium]|jgi:molybdopterin converting factor subunit 1
MTVRVQLFAAARDLAGAASLEVDLPDGPDVSVNVAALRAALLRSAPRLERLASTLLIAVNSEYATDATKIVEGAEIAAFPPVSGG